MLSLVSAPQQEPVSLDEAKAHLRVETDDEDGLIDGLIVAARELVETTTRRAVMPQTWDLVLDGFCASEYYRDGALILPKPPVTAVSSISYVDTTGTTQVLPSSQYRTELPAGPKAMRARITEAYGVSWPSTRAVMGAVTIRFVCGYANEGAVPYGIKAAMLLLIGHWYARREASSDGAIGETVPGVESLLWPYAAF